MDIREKIKKLLALATSPNENEAKAAMLKAKKLMMAHKLSESEFNENECELVHIAVDDVTWTTDSGNTWMVGLCKTIANNYFSVSSWLTARGTRTHKLQITGMKQDAELCADVIKYAVGFVLSEMTRLERARKCTASGARSYANGFVEGLEVAYESQKEDHEEWALVAEASKEVKDYADNLSTKSVRCKQPGRDVYAYTKGVRDGLTFTPNKVLEKE